MTRPLYGLRAWILQRVSALYVAAFLIYLLIRFTAGAPEDYVAWHAWAAQPHVAILGAVFFIMLLAHAWVGARDVILDYAPSLALRVVLLIALALVLLLCAVWLARILLLVTLA